MGFRFFLLLTLALGAVLALCAVLYKMELDQNEQRLRERELVRVGLLAHFARVELRPMANDLRLLADGDGLRSVLATGQPADLDRAIRRAIFFSKNESEYDQVRYLDEKGQEVLRINRNGEKVPADQLQNKFSRPYFQKTSALNPGEIYISAFDLNVEHGEVEEPFKPTIRFATPVFDASGQRRGIYIINYLGENLLTELQKAVQGSGHRLRVLNSQGYWLKAARREQEWGFMFPARKELTLSHSDPALWKQLSGSPEGQVRTNSGGMITWQQVQPGEFVNGGKKSVVADEQFLIIASEITAEEWDERLAGLKQTFQIITPGLLILATCSMGFFRSRKRALETLRRNEESLFVTLNSIGDGVLATDTQGNITRLNRLAEEMTGWSWKEALGRPINEIFNIINERTRQPAPIPVQDVLTTGKTQGLASHTMLVSRSGTERAIADSAAPIRASNGLIIGVVLVFRDVSEERIAEARLAAARSQLDRFFTLSIDFLCISNANGYFVRVSSAVTDILGWSTEEFLARPYISFIHPDDHGATIREVERQMKTRERVLKFENRYQHKDGSWRILSWRSVPQPDGLMYATARDVTENRRVEEEIKRLNRDLQERAAQLETANKELEAFSYSVSHDLRAPLRHVQGYVDMLSREAKATLSPKSQRYLKTIADAGSSMGQLIDDLLAFSRMGRTEMREGVVDLNQVVEEVRKPLELATTERNIQWKIASLPKVRGDAAMLKQVLANLLGNAVKYSRKRDPAEIEVGCAGSENEQVIFFIRDNGAGFDMQYAGKLFGVFQRLHRADEFEGTGIGLANVQRIIMRHGGRTWAEGKIDAGATFYFTLKSIASNHPSPPT